MWTQISLRKITSINAEVAVLINNRQKQRCLKIIYYVSCLCEWLILNIYLNWLKSIIISRTKGPNICWVWMIILAESFSSFKDQDFSKFIIVHCHMKQFIFLLGTNQKEPAGLSWRSWNLLVAEGWSSWKHDGGWTAGKSREGSEKCWLCLCLQGASVLRMLEDWMGRDLFRDGCRVSFRLTFMTENQLRDDNVLSLILPEIPERLLLQERKNCKLLGLSCWSTWDLHDCC